MSFDEFILENEIAIKSLAEVLKDFKIKGFPLRYENAKSHIINWLRNFSNCGFTDYKLPSILLKTIQFIKTETLVQKITELVEPLINLEQTYIAPLGETSESSHRIVANFNQYENYFPNLSSLLNNIPDGINANIILIDDFLNSGGQIINIFYALLNLDLPIGETNDEIEYRTSLNEAQIKKLKKAQIFLIYYQAFDEGIEKIISRCKTELSLDVQVKRYLATNKNESAFGDPYEQEAIKNGLRQNVSSSSSSFTGFKTEELTNFYNLLVNVGEELNRYNKPQWDENKITQRALGYSNLGRLIITDYNIPTISITALWQSGDIKINSRNIKWEPLVPRREKKLGISNGETYEALKINATSIEEIEIVDSDTEFDTRVLKGYDEVYKILKVFRPNSQIKEVTKNENKAAKIGYVFYRLDDVSEFKISYYLYLFQGINSKQTYEDIKKRFPDLNRYSKSLVILLPKEKHQVNVEIRKENIRNLFSPLNIFYIDEFFIECCTPQQYFEKSEIKYLDNQKFIFPIIRSGEFYYEKFLESINQWIGSENEPILVLKGTGGVGKTTLAEYIADKFLTYGQKSEKKSKVIFINSHDTIIELQKREKFDEELDLYKIYEADNNVNKKYEYKLSEDQFKYHLDLGNLLIVIDGLDEVISRVVKFDVDKFLESILKFSNQSGNGKVIITCRSYFWQTSKFKSSEITSVEILPFNQSQAKSFFIKCFPTDQYKQTKALHMAEKLGIRENGVSYYHPYLLDIINNYIITDKISDVDEAFIESKLLEKKEKYDVIIYEFCKRESLRITEGFSIDDQVKLFIELAIDNKGSIKEQELPEFIYTRLSRHVDKSTIEGFKSHPFIICEINHVKFKYDFFNQYFKSIYISQYIKYESEYSDVDIDFINVLVEDCWYNSGTINELKSRIKKWTEEDLFKILDLLGQIKLNSNSLEKDTYRKAISNLFYISLTLNHKFVTNDINSNTELIRLMFGSNQTVIEDFYLVNFNSKKDNIRFDFRGLNFNNCYFDNFESFWICPADNKTIFYNCTLINLNFIELLKSPIPRQNFRECTFNEEIDEFYRQKLSLKGENRNLHIRRYLEEFFKQFFVMGKIDRKPKIQITQFLRTKSEELMGEQDFLGILYKELGAVEYFFENGEEQIKIIEEYRQDVKSFLRNGMISPRIEKIIKRIKEKIK